MRNNDRLTIEGEEIAMIPSMSTRLVEPYYSKFVEYCKEKNVSYNFMFNVIVKDFFDTEKTDFIQEINSKKLKSRAGIKKEIAL